MQKRARLVVLILLGTMLVQSCMPAVLEETPEPTAFPEPAEPGNILMPGDDFPFMYEIGKGRINDLDYSPGTGFLAVSHGDSLTIFQSQSMEAAATMPFESRVIAARWSPDGSRLAVGLADRHLELLNIDSMSLDLTIHTDDVDDMDWNYDGAYLAVISGDTLYVYDASSGVLLCEEAAAVEVVVWAPDRNQLLLRNSGYVHTLDVDRMETIVTEVPIDISRNPVFDGEWIRTEEEEQIHVLSEGSYDGSIIRAEYHRHAETGLSTFAYEEESGQFELLPETDSIVFSNSDGQLTVQHTSYDADREIIPAHSGAVAALAAGAGNLLASAGVDGVLIIWDTISWEVLWEIEGYLPALSGLEFWDPATVVGFSGESGDVFFLDLYSGELVRRIPTSLDSISSLTFLPDHDRFIVTYFDPANLHYLSGDSVLQIYSLDGVLEAEIEGSALGACWSGREEAFYAWDTWGAAKWNPVSLERASVTGLYDFFEEESPLITHSPDCSQLAVPLTVPVEEIVFIDFQTGERQRIESGTEHALVRTEWSPDQEMLIGSDLFGSVAVLDGVEKTVEAVYEISPTGSGVDHIAWSPDGAWTAVSTFDNHLIVFDPGSGLVEAGLWLPDTVLDVTWSEDGETIAVAVANGTILLLPMSFLGEITQGGVS